MPRAVSLVGGPETKEIRSVPIRTSLFTRRLRSSRKLNTCAVIYMSRHLERSIDLPNTDELLVLMSRCTSGKAALGRGRAP